jgi:nicotinamide-nucleotide amidase
VSVRAGILVTGTEVIGGRISDRNGPWVAERLTELGVEVAHLLTVGDRRRDLEAALRFLEREGMDLVVTTGGLGPTADDLTAEVVAEFAGRELVLDEGMEQKIAKTLRDVEDEFDLSPLEITTCLRNAELEVDIRYRPAHERLSERVRREIRERHGRFLYSEDGTSVDEQVAGLLAGRRIGVAESSTGGLLAARLTELPGASAYVAGGVVAYSDEAKSELLGVPPELIGACGSVSPEVAEAMAEGAMQRFEADVACGITGVAGPGGGTERKPVGYACLCVRDAEGHMIARDPRLPGGRMDVRERSVTVAMHMLRVLLGGEEPPL